MTTPTDALGALLQRLGSPPSGKPGVVVSGPGVGKTSLVIHVALDTLLAERRVLHVSLGDAVEHVRSQYDEVLRAAHGLDGADHATASVAIERRRMVLSYTEREFDPNHLSDQVRMLADVAQFSPDLLVVDGLHGASWASHGASIAALSARLGIPTWAVVTTDDASPPQGPPVAFLLTLTTAPDGTMQLVRHAGDQVDTLPWTLDPATLTLSNPASSADRALPASSCTLYSGGAGGAEATFGIIAERHGVREVNFTFEGHRQARIAGSVTLTPRELEAGDVSLVYVSRKLQRSYNQHGLIRRVLQTLWHMVSRAQQVFVIGVIQEDGTVVGGTGWSVELAKMWSKDLWVFDQERHGWFAWRGGEWTPGEPRIETAQFCGTGTRDLSDEGRAAIEALFARSFG